MSSYCCYYVAVDIFREQHPRKQATARRNVDSVLRVNHQFVLLLNILVVDLGEEHPYKRRVPCHVSQDSGCDDGAGGLFFHLLEGNKLFSVEIALKCRGNVRMIPKNLIESIERMVFKANFFNLLVHQQHVGNCFGSIAFHGRGVVPIAFTAVGILLDEQCAARQQGGRS
jgi:hypothetical protein